MRRIVLVAVLMGLIVGCWGAIEGPEIKFSDPDTYIDDGKVYIKRDENSKMLFNDDGISSEVLLETLVSAGGVSDHGGLTGLGNDDHSQYYDQGRLNTKLGTSESGSGATYVGSLPISGAVGDATNIGEFVSDVTIQYKRPGGTAVVATSNGQFNSIPLAIAWLVANYGTAGGTVRIHPGIYSGGFSLAQNIRLIGEPGVTIQYGSIGGYCITVPASATGCEINNIKLLSTNSTGKTQAILVVSGSDLLMRDCVIDWDSSVGNEDTIFVAGNMVAYNCDARSWDLCLYAGGPDLEWSSGRITNTASGTSNGPIFIEDSSEAIFRDLIVEANGANSGIFGSTGAIGYLYDVTISNAITDLDGVFGTTYYTAGAQYSTVGSLVTINEIVEGRATQLRNYIEKAAGAIDYAYRYRLDEITKFSVDYLGNIYMAGALQAANLQGGSNVITVAKSGGDYQTIQDAIDSVTDAASTNTYTILIYPGIYEEQVTIDENYVSLLGHLPKGSDMTESDNPGVVITWASTGVGSDLMTMLVASGGGAALTGITLANLTIINTASFGTGIAQEALDIGRGDTYGTAKHNVYVRNCSLYGEQDTVFVNIAGNVVFQDCYIQGRYDIMSIADDIKIFNCDFYMHSTTIDDSCLWFGRTGDVAFRVDIINSKFDSIITKTQGGVGVWGHSNVTFNILNCSVMPNSVSNCFNEAGESGTINIFGTNGEGWPGTANWLKFDNIDVVEDVLIGDQLDVTGETELNDKLTIIDSDVVFTNVDYKFRYLAATGIMEWWTDPSYDVNLYPESSNVLKTDDLFQCNSLETGTGTAPANGIGSQGIISSTVSLKSCETRWKDYDVVSWVGSSEWAYTGPNDYLYDTLPGDNYCYFPITYEAGTTVSRVRVKYDGGPIDDGVDYRVVKRQDSGTATGWTLVGVLQSVESAVVVVDIYDIPDFEIDEGYSYAIEVMSVVGAVDVKLYSVGIETIIREW